jgi:hypothetical protein
MFHELVDVSVGITHASTVIALVAVSEVPSDLYTFAELEVKLPAVSVSDPGSDAVPEALPVEGDEPYAFDAVTVNVKGSFNGKL